MRRSSAFRSLLSTLTVIGAAMFSATASATTLQERPATYNPETKWVTFGVTLGYTAYPGGNVEFTENDTLLGSVYPTCYSVVLVGHYYVSQEINPCDITLRLQNYPLGAHTITASYPGDDRGNAPATLTFTIYVTEAGYLPAVISMLSD